MKQTETHYRDNAAERIEMLVGRHSVDWRRIDWRQQDVDIALELGMSRERVRQVRRKLNMPRSATHKSPTKILKVREFLEQRRAELWTLTYPEIRARLPVPLSTVRANALFRELGIGRPKGVTALSKETVRAHCSIDADGCWIWLGSFGNLPLQDGKNARHIVYRLFKGRIPAATWVTPQCGKKRCVRPQCLAAVTPSRACRIMRRPLRGFSRSEMRVALQSRKQGQTLREIARLLDRPLSSISQKLKGVRPKR